MQSQECKICHIPKTLDAFHKGKGYANGHIKICKACRAANNAANKESIAAYNKQYAIDHAQEIKEQRHEHYLENKDALNKRSTEGHRANPAKTRARQNRYYASHQEECLERTLAWQAANPDAVRLAAVASEARKRARAKNDPLNNLTTTELRIIFAAYNHRCVYCPPDCLECSQGTHKMSHDHIIPRALGGPNTASNVVPCCIPHNAKKHTGPPPIPMDDILKKHPFRQP